MLTIKKHDCLVERLTLVARDDVNCIRPRDMASGLMGCNSRTSVYTLNRLICNPMPQEKLEKLRKVYLAILLLLSLLLALMILLITFQFV